MNSPPRLVKRTTGVMAVLMMMAVIWVFRGYVWPTLSNSEVATMQASLDPGLFTKDFSVQANLLFSPRFYYLELILVLARLGVPLAFAVLVWQWVAIAMIAWSIRALVQAWAWSPAAGAVFAAWALFAQVGTLGLVVFYIAAPVPATWAGACALMGAALIVQGKPGWGLCLFAAATCLQFLVGLYAGALALAILWRLGRHLPWRGIAVWVASLALVYLPMRFAGTSSSALSNSEFVRIYADVRLPHHLVPSSWGWPLWVQAATFYLGALFLLWRADATPTKEPRNVAALVVAIVALALLANYLFVEVWPWALAAKLQLARVTPLGQGVMFGLLAAQVSRHLLARQWLAALLLSAIPFTLFPGVLLILAAVLLYPAQSTVNPARAWILAIAVLCAFQPASGLWPWRALHYGQVVALVLGCWFALACTRQGVLIASTAAAWLGAIGLADVSRGPRWPGFLCDRFCIDAPPHDPPAILGDRFGRVSPVDALVLVPPSGETWTFKLYSRRSSVVDDKNGPYSDKGLAEWGRRMEDVLGTKLGLGSNTIQAWKDRTPSELAALAKRYGAGYILDYDPWHPALPGRRIDSQSGWSLWAMPARP